MTVAPSPAAVVSELIVLHEFKDRRYKDAWRKRGELVGIFCNIARKYDRLVVARTEDDPDEAEARADTAADLCVYAIKYVTWLIEHDPASAAAIPEAERRSWSGAHGHPAVATALRRLADGLAAPPDSLEAAFQAIATPFVILERILVDQQPSSAAEKTALAWKLAAASLAYLWRLALDEPAAWETFRAYVANPA
jgi:hypothetical protein